MESRLRRRLRAEKLELGKILAIQFTFIVVFFIWYNFSILKTMDISSIILLLIVIYLIWNIPEKISEFDEMKHHIQSIKNYSEVIDKRCDNIENKLNDIENLINKKRGL